MSVGKTKSTVSQTKTYHYSTTFKPWKSWT